MKSKKYRWKYLLVGKDPFLSAILLLFLLIIMILASHACQPGLGRTLVVYAGKGLKMPVEEIKVRFEEKHPGIRLEMIYAGSKTLLRTIQKTQRGDVFISGDRQTIERGREFIEGFRAVAWHVPVVAVTREGQGYINSFKDLARRGIRVAAGNTEMCVLGRVTDVIVARSESGDLIKRNILIRSPDPIELIRVLREGEADAAIIWRDMLRWPMAKGLVGVEIPAGLNQLEEVDAAVLRTSTEKAYARLFVDFLCSAEGRAVFNKNGFSGVDMR